MSQTHRQSLFESVANVAVGYGVALASQLLIFPLVGVRANLKQNVAIGVAFTVVSLVRSYALRRMFDRWHR